MKLAMTTEERAEFEALVSEVMAAHKTTGDRADALLDGLRDARQAHKSWASHVLDDATHDGLAKVIRSASRKKRCSYKAKKGAVVDLASVGGVRREGQWVQLAFEEMSRPEMAGHIDLLDSQIAHLGARRGALQRLMGIFERHPTARSLADALDAEGTTLDDVLGAVAA